MLSVVYVELKLMESAPSLMMADINENIEHFMERMQWVKDEDWTDVGGIAHLCPEGPGHSACQVPAGAQATRRDVILASELILPAIAKFDVSKIRTCTPMTQ